MIAYLKPLVDYKSAKVEWGILNSQPCIERFSYLLQSLHTTQYVHATKEAVEGTVGRSMLLRF